jgi:hypothetical protein
VEVRSSKATNESETTRGFGVSENLHRVKGGDILGGV